MRWTARRNSCLPGQQPRCNLATPQRFVAIGNRCRTCVQIDDETVRGLLRKYWTGKR